MLLTTLLLSILPFLGPHGQVVMADSAPTVTAISPASGPTGGGTTVTITGTNFTGATAVTFGGTNASSFSVLSATRITAVTPAHPAGTVDTNVTTVGGAAATSAADQFTYVTPPVATATSTPTNTPTSTPTNTATSTATATPTSTGTSDPVVLTAGDIACDPTDASYNAGSGTASACQQRATSNELTGTVAVLPLGDTQYDAATLSQFQQVYDPTWGRAKASSYPAVGNHEYITAGASGYYTYFGSAASPQDTNCTAKCKGYYSYDLGAWHLVVLNSECAQVGGCAAGSPQEQWLKADLAAHATVCTLAYWHRPLFSSGWSLGEAAVHDLWVDLYNAHADLVLNGHDHDYERFAPQDPSGHADPTNGLTEIIVGTGGKSHFTFIALAANSVVRNATSYGILKLTLHPTSFDWQFLPDTQSGNGTFTDAGSRACHL